VNLYLLCVALHLLAMSVWLGHMFIWSLVVGPATKRLESRETADTLRDASLSHGGLGWPALAVLIPTGLYMLHYRGIDIGTIVSGDAFLGSQGKVLAVKLGLVAAMVFYQAAIGHRKAPIAIYFNMLSAVLIVAASVLIVRGWI
jgi:uncharacterized membrane protein